MLHERIGKPSTGEGSALFQCVSGSSYVVAWVARAHAIAREVYIHRLLVSNELDPSLDLRKC
jgi:hypothetical protein